MRNECHQTRSEETTSGVNVPGQQVFRRVRSVVSRVVDGRTLIVPLRGKVGDLASIYSFSGTGTLIWQLLDEPRTFPELVSAIEQEYDVSKELAQKDVRQFLDDMLSAGLAQIEQRFAVTAMEMTATESTPLWETADSH